MNSNYWKVSTFIIVVTFFLLTFSIKEVHARMRYPVPIPLSAGLTIYEIGATPDFLTLLSPDLKNYKLGYKCFHLSFLGMDIVCWGKELVVFKGNQYSEIPDVVRTRLEADFPFSKTKRSFYKKHGFITSVIVLGLFFKILIVMNRNAQNSSQLKNLTRQLDQK